MIKANSHLLEKEGKLIFKCFVLLLVEIYSDLLLLFVVWMLFFFLIGNKKVYIYLTELLWKSIILTWINCLTSLYSSVPKL